METYEVRRPPQTEDEERVSVLLELGYISAKVEQITGDLPPVIRKLREEGPLLSTFSTRQLADLCADIRSEYPGLPREANERR